jgi:DNA-binding response OmpR family regulator
MVNSEQHKESIRVLVVDDEENILELLDTVFTGEGYEVHRAANGVEALALIEKIEFDLIVTDHVMPEMTGIEFFRMAKKLKSGMEGRFLFISGRLGDTEFHQLADETRAGILFKPFEIKELREMARMLLRHRNGS